MSWRWMAVGACVGQILVPSGVSAQSAAQSFAPKSDRSEQKLALPKGYMPPTGMCRIWLDEVPAPQQPAPTDCATAIKNRPPKGRVVFGDDAAQRGREKGEKGDEKRKGRKP